MQQKFNDLNEVLENEDHEEAALILFVTDEGVNLPDFAATDFNPSDFSTT